MYPNREITLTSALKKVNESIEKRICRLVAQDGISFRTLVISKVIPDLFHKTGQALLASANTIRGIVITFAQEFKQELIKIFVEFKAAGFLFSLTMDVSGLSKIRKH